MENQIAINELNTQFDIRRMDTKELVEWLSKNLKEKANQLYEYIVNHEPWERFEVEGMVSAYKEILEHVTMLSSNFQDSCNVSFLKSWLHEGFLNNFREQSKLVKEDSFDISSLYLGKQIIYGKVLILIGTKEGRCEDGKTN